MPRRTVTRRAPPKSRVKARIRATSAKPVRGARRIVKSAAAPTAPSVNFSVAPTTPFIPVRPIVTLRSLMAMRAALPTERPPKLPASPPVPEPPTPPSPTLTLGERPPSTHLVDLRPASRPRKREAAGIGPVEVPRTLSGRSRTGAVWNGLAIVVLFRFFGFLLLKAALGAGKLVILPLILGLKIVDRHFDIDRIFLPASAPAPRASSRAPTRSHFVAEPAPTPPVPSAAEERPPRPRAPFSLRRALISFAGTSLAIILPFQALHTYRSLHEARSNAIAAGEAGASVLRAAGDGALPDPVALGEASAAFIQARAAVERIGTVGNALLERLPGIGDEFRSGKALLSAGEQLTAASAILTGAFGVLDDPELNLTAKIAQIEERARRSAPQLDAALASLSEVTTVPEGVDSDDVRRVTETTRSLTDTLHGFLELAPFLRDLLGERTVRRFLILFQNNAELRPTGGFIGTFALADVDRGRIRAIEVPAGGSYDLQGSLRAHVLAPQPLRLIAAKWEFQDGNWFPDFPTSARKLMWFYNQSAGPTVDGVIALNAPVLERLLEAVGPIAVPGYGVTADAQTILATAQEIVESEEARATGKPKQFIADLLPLVLDRVLTADEETIMRTLSIFAAALQEKDVQFHFTDPTAQGAFDARGWTGRLPALPPGFDGLAVVRTNIAGEKSDAKISTRITHAAKIAPDGTVTDTVKVTLTHEGTRGERFTGARNVTYLRVYVPQGAALHAATGDIRPPDYRLFDLPPEGYGPDQTLAEVSGATFHDPMSGVALNNEFGRTVFGAWMQTDPGMSSTITFAYTLPFKVLPVASEPTLLERIGIRETPPPAATYGIIVTKQSGAARTDLTSSLVLPDGWYPTAAEPEGIARAAGWQVSFPLTTDRAMGAIITAPRPDGTD